MGSGVSEEPSAPLHPLSRSSSNLPLVISSRAAAAEISALRYGFPRGGAFLGRAARGPVAPRKMAGRPPRGSFHDGSRPSTRAQRRGSLIAAPSNRGQKWT